MEVSPAWFWGAIVPGGKGVVGKLNSLIAALFLFDVALFISVGVLLRAPGDVLAAFIMIFIAIISTLIYRRVRPSPRLQRHPFLSYLVVVLLLSILEETMVTLNGGGLNGEATSLPHDLILSIPVFLGIGLGIALTDRISPLKPGEHFLFGAIFGLLIEIVIPGDFSITLVGGAMGIYGYIMNAFTPENRVEGEIGAVGLLKRPLLTHLLGWVSVIVGAIFGDTVYRIYIK